MTRYAGVIIDQVHPSLDKVFHYGIPEELEGKVILGMRVLVPFGPGKSLQGYIISLDKNIDVPINKIKPIKKSLDLYPLLLKDILPLIEWMKKKYHCMYIEAIRCFIPPGIRVNIKEKTQRKVYLTAKLDIEKSISLVEKRSPNMAAILRVLSQKDGITTKELIELSGATSSSIRSLENKGMIEIVDEKTYRSPWRDIETKPSLAPVLNTQQKAAVDSIQKGLETGGTILLHGVTGSGKTEVYMKAVQLALSRGTQGIVLVPEISLTPQTVGRFKSRFGEDVAVLHSGLSMGERYDEWRRIKNGEVHIVVGARSAIFAPFEKVGIIIIDEAHEDTYKSDVRPRYAASEIAVQRCSMHGGLLVLGTATPGLEDYYKTAQGKYQLIELPGRIDQQRMPEVEIVDMRRELQMGNRSIFSQALYTALNQVISKGEQAILLMNRRGYAQFVSCRSCGFVIKCSDCEISLTYHADKKALICHYCGRNAQYPKICPECESKYIKHFGLGTQRVEEELKSLFPNVRLLRMDMDTTSGKGSHHRILDAFGSGKYDILLGTQMVAKGLDFPGVTLVGVIAADTSLNLPDYRSSEKTFQLVTQVAGRAGRGVLPGQVVVQTYQPDHYTIRYASKHDYIGFYHEEMDIRKRFDYPPFSQIIRILLTGETEKELVKYSNTMLEWVREYIDSREILKQGCIDIGAYPAPLERIKNKFRWHLLIRTKTSQSVIDGCHLMGEELLGAFYRTDISLVLDFNPRSLL